MKKLRNTAHNNNLIKSLWKNIVGRERQSGRGQNLGAELQRSEITGIILKSIEKSTRDEPIRFKNQFFSSFQFIGSSNMKYSIRIEKFNFRFSETTSHHFYWNAGRKGSVSCLSFHRWRLEIEIPGLSALKTFVFSSENIHRNNYWFTWRLVYDKTLYWFTRKIVK